MSLCCQGCGEITDNRLCCPKCSNFGRASFFCSQQCFKKNWASHNRLHAIMKPPKTGSLLTSGSFFETFHNNENSQLNMSSIIDIPPIPEKTELNHLQQKPLNSAISSSSFSSAPSSPAVSCSSQNEQLIQHIHNTSIKEMKPTNVSSAESNISTIPLSLLSASSDTSVPIDYSSVVITTSSEPPSTIYSKIVSSEPIHDAIFPTEIVETLTDASSVSVPIKTQHSYSRHTLESNISEVLTGLASAGDQSTRNIVPIFTASIKDDLSLDTTNAMSNGPFHNSNKNISLYSSHVSERHILNSSSAKRKIKDQQYRTSSFFKIWFKFILPFSQELLYRTLVLIKRHCYFCRSLGRQKLFFLIVCIVVFTIGWLARLSHKSATGQQQSPWINNPYRQESNLEIILQPAKPKTNDNSFYSVLNNQLDNSYISDNDNIKSMGYFREKGIIRREQVPHQLDTNTDILKTAKKFDNLPYHTLENYENHRPVGIPELKRQNLENKQQYLMSKPIFKQYVHDENKLNTTLSSLLTADHSTNKQTVEKSTMTPRAAEGLKLEHSQNQVTQKIKLTSTTTKSMDINKLEDKIIALESYIRKYNLTMNLPSGMTENSGSSNTIKEKEKENQSKPSVIQQPVKQNGLDPSI